MGCAVSAPNAANGSGRKKKKGTKKRAKRAQQFDEEGPTDETLPNPHPQAGGSSQRSDAARRQSMQEFPVNSVTAGVSSHHDDHDDSPKTGDELPHHRHGAAGHEPERSVPVVMNPLVASPLKIPADESGIASISLSQIEQQERGGRNGTIPQPPLRSSSSYAARNGDSNGKGSQLSGSVDASRSHSLVPIGACESATSSHRKDAQHRQLVGQVRGADVASDCSNDGSSAGGGDENENRNDHTRNDSEEEEEVSDSRSDVEDPRRPSEFPDQTDDPEVAAMRLNCPEFHVDAAPLMVLVQLVRQGKLSINQTGDHTIGGAFRTKMRFRDVAGWMAEVGTIPAGVVSLSHQDRSKGGQNYDQKLTARLLEQNHRLLLQLRSRTTSNVVASSSSYNGAPLNFVASLNGPQGSPALGSAIPSGSPVFQTAQPSVSGGNQSSGLPSSQLVAPNLFTKTSGPDQGNGLLGAGAGGSSFDEDAARRYSRGSNRNKIPDRNTAADDDFDATNFYEELEDEERRLSTIKESSSDEDF
jgi:hypothetical protein